jgi:hypothetical protein
MRLPMSTVRDTAADHLGSEGPAAKRVALGKLADLLERQGIDLDEIGRVNRINAWQGFLKDEQGEPQLVDMVGIQLSPTWQDGPAWPVVQPAKPMRPRALPPRPKVKRADGVQTAVILPDPQIGYRRDLEDPGVLDPFHDEAAMAVALAILRDVQPDRVVNLGDLLDMAEASRFVREPGFALTTQPTIDRAHEFLAQQRETCPDAQIDLIEGNHDRRIGIDIVANAKWAFGIRRAGTPADWPVMSVPHLLRLDELGIGYVDGYPSAGRRCAPSGRWCMRPRRSFRGTRTGCGSRRWGGAPGWGR